MKTKVSAGGRKGTYHIKPKFCFREWTFSLEPWEGIYYVFHGGGIPLFFEKVVGDYKDYRVRAKIWNTEDAKNLWSRTGAHWEPVIDWVYEVDIDLNIRFSFHPARIEWRWRPQAGVGLTKSKKHYIIAGLIQRFDCLGSALQNPLNTEPLAAPNPSGPVR